MTDTDVATSAINVWRQTNIPHRFQSAMGDTETLQECLDMAKPAGYTTKWTQSFRDGKVLRSDDARLCGRGLYLVGDFEADFIGAAILQSLTLGGYVESALYINVEDLLESESPEGERLGDRRWVDLLLIRGLGEQHTTVSNWANTTLTGIIRRRFDRGLPTIVTSSKPPTESGLSRGLYEQAFIKVLFEK